MTRDTSRKALPGEAWYSRPISWAYTTTCMLTEQADDLLRTCYMAERWDIDALRKHCIRQAAMIEALAGKNARQRLELRKLNRALAKRATPPRGAGDAG